MRAPAPHRRPRTARPRDEPRPRADREGFTTLDITIAQGRIASVVPAARRASTAISRRSILTAASSFRVSSISTPTSTRATSGPATPIRTARSRARWRAPLRTARLELVGRRSRAHEWISRCAARSPTGPGDAHPSRLHRRPDGDLLAGFREMRDAWRGRIELQAVSLFPADLALDDERSFARTSRRRSPARGASSAASPSWCPTDHRAARPHVRAARRRASISISTSTRTARPRRVTLERVAEAVIRNRFGGKVLVGHCCSLAQRPRRRGAAKRWGRSRRPGSPW